MEKNQKSDHEWWARARVGFPVFLAFVAVACANASGGSGGEGGSGMGGGASAGVLGGGGAPGTAKSGSGGASVGAGGTSSKATGGSGAVTGTGYVAGGGLGGGGAGNGGAGSGDAKGTGGAAGAAGVAGGGGITGAGGTTSSGGGPEDAGAGGVLYAAPSGSGTSCTLASPCTIDQAVATVRGMTATMASDIVVYLRGGTYARSSTLTLGPGDSGQNGHTVTYQAYTGEVPVISGAVPVTGFAQHEAAKNIWQAALPAGIQGLVGRQLFVNGVRAVRARSAGSPAGATATAAGFSTSDGSYATYGNPSLLEVVQDNDWKQMRCPIQSITTSGGGASLNVVASCWSGNNLNVPNVGFPFNGAGLPAMQGISWVENAYELLSQPGQFYVDTVGGTVSYIPRSGENLATADVEIPILETILSLSGTPGHLAPQNDTDAAATYTGSWTHATGRGYGDFDDDVHATETANDSATISFNGSGIDILGETNSDEGAFEVYLDGTLDSSSHTQAATSRLAQQVIYSALGLSSGAHTVKVVAAGGQYTVIDGFVVVPATIAPVHDITFSGITFAYGTWNLPSTVGYIDNQAGVLWDTTTTIPSPIRIQAAVQVHRGMNVSFSGCTFSHLGGTGVDLADGTQSSQIDKCTITDTSGGGISIGEVDDYFQTESALMTAKDTISNNTITDVGFDYHDAVGIWAGYTRGVTIEHNEIAHTPYSGLSLGWGWGWASPCTLQQKQGLSDCKVGTIYAGENQILANYIHDVMNYLFDGGPIYTNGGQGDGGGTTTSTLAQNYLTVGNHTNNMIYQDEGSSYWDTHDNVTSQGGSC